MLELNENLIEDYNVAKDLYENGLYSIAKKKFVDLILKNPFVWEFWFSLSIIYLIEKDYKKALPFFNIASTLNPNDANIYFHIAECHLSLNELKKALNFLNLAEKYSADSSLLDKILILKKQNFEESRIE